MYHEQVLAFAPSWHAAAAAVCVLAGQRFGQFQESYYAEGPASPHYSGYVPSGPRARRNTVTPGFFGGYYTPTYTYTPTYYSTRSYYYTPAYYGNPQPLVISSAYMPPAASEEEQEARLDSAHIASIQVRVPANAEIWFEDGKTKQTGALRNFVSPPLETGKTFHYDIRARWTDGSGKIVERMKSVPVSAGRASMVDFTGPGM